MLVRVVSWGNLVEERRCGCGKDAGFGDAKVFARGDDELHLEGRNYGYIPLIASIGVRISSALTN